MAELVGAAIPPGADLTGGYVWVAGQTDALRAVRRYLRKELRLPAERFQVVGYWMPDGDSWTQRYEALPAAVRSELDSMWHNPADEPEDLAIQYEDRLGKLGLRPLGIGNTYSVCLYFIFVFRCFPDVA
ncbi:SIP domain-containing protein [Streptomyces sp. NBC_01429]|uniref:SIP domain-containing protein n=1 Tax=Streptomyces sp. NBC_01429 TaxID=2903862 RepID=UPI003FCCD97F